MNEYDARRHAYQHPRSTLTLREGLREYFEQNPNLIDPEDPAKPASAQAAELFRGHDTVHVVFGTNTDIRQEAMTDTWAVLGTTAGLGYLRYLSTPEAMQILKEIGQGTAQQSGWRHLVRETVAAVPSMVEVWRRSRKMFEPWPWLEHESWLDVSLVEIRREFGIEVFQPGVPDDAPVRAAAASRAAA